MGGCSLEQDGVDFYIVGADAVRKKLGETPEYSVLDCGGVDFKEHEFGQWHHGYHFTKVSEIPNFGSMVHGKDFFIEVYNGGTNQLNAGIGVSYVKHSNSELVMTSVNGLKGLMSKFIILTTGQYQHRLLFLNQSISRLHLELPPKIFYWLISLMLERLFALVLYQEGGKDGTLLT